MATVGTELAQLPGRVAPAAQGCRRWAVLVTAARRKAVYALALAAVGILVAYGVITTEQGDLWLALGAAVLGLLGASGPVTALRHITPDPPDDDPAPLAVEPLILPTGDDPAVPDDDEA